jgi:hypothetical protein
MFLVVKDRSYAVVDLAGGLPGQTARFASGRVEDIVSFSGKFGSESQIFLKKINTYHAAAGELRHYWEQTARLNAHRVSPVHYRSYTVAVWTTNTTTCATSGLYLNIFEVTQSLTRKYSSASGRGAWNILLV